MKNLTVVGVGALGSHLIPLLRNLDLNVKVVDFDRVEAKNVQSQFHPKAQIGKNKTQALQATMNFLFGKKIEIIMHKLVEGNANEILSNSDAVVDCLDNGVSRRLVQRFIRDNKIPTLHGALSPNGELGRVMWDEWFAIDDEQPGQATCENGRYLPFIGMTSSYLAFSLQEFLSSGRKMNFHIARTGAILV